MTEDLRENKAVPLLNKLVNIAIVALLVIITWKYGKPYVVRQEASPSVKIGNTLRIPSIEWKKYKKNVVLALSTDCKFCSESADFYNNIVSNLPHGGSVGIVAIFPQTVDDSLTYLKSKNIPIPQANAKQTEFKQIGIVTTPTIYICDDQGQIIDMWTGKVTKSNEHRIYKKLSLNNLENLLPNKQIVDGMSLKELVVLQSEKRPLLIVDVSRRELYEVNHIPNSINIPFDELEVRASNELVGKGRIVFYCHCADDSLSQQAVDFAIDSNLQDISYLKGGLQVWQEANASQK